MNIYTCPKHGTGYKACKCFTQGVFYQYLEKMKKDQPKLADRKEFKEKDAYSSKSL